MTEETTLMLHIEVTGSLLRSRISVGAKQLQQEAAVTADRFWPSATFGAPFGHEKVSQDALRKAK